MFSASIQYLEYDIAWKAFIELRKAGERKGKKKKKKKKNKINWEPFRIPPLKLLPISN